MESDVRDVRQQQIQHTLVAPMPEDGVQPIDILLGPDGLREFSSLVGRMATGTYR
jgi:hypothetical protein